MLCCRRPAVKEDEPVQLKAPASSAAEGISAPPVLALTHALDAKQESAWAAAEQSNEDFWNSVINVTAASVSDGSIPVTSTFPGLPALAAGGGDKAGGETVRGFLSSLQPADSPQVSRPAHQRSPSSISTASTTASGSGSAAASAEAAHAEEGLLGVDYQLYPVRGYVRLPLVLRPFINLPYLDHYLLVGRPSMAPSCGLRGYKAAVPKKRRRAAPFLVVIDKPGMLEHWRDERYTWIEFHLGDVFVLDVSGMKSMEDYKKTLNVKQRWNFKDRQKKFNNPELIRSEVVPVAPGDQELADLLWPLYRQTGERNGFVVLAKADFYRFHLEVPGLVVMMVKDVRDPAHPKLVSFCTGVRWHDVLMPLWCGTDYSNDLNRTCAVYFNMLYNYVALAIADPGINTVDLGASMRTAKTAIGFKPVPSSGYFRCKGVVMQAIVQAMLARYFRPEKLINDM